MDDLDEIIELSAKAASLSMNTRHANFRIVPVMYYDNVSAPTLQMCQSEEEGSLDSDRWDYVRFRTLELLAQEIYAKRLVGDIAEAGVFRGDFAGRMNGLFPNKKLHLFDTFSGFLETDISIESDRGLAASHFVNSIGQYEATSKNQVLDAMPHPIQCTIHQGDVSVTSRYRTEAFCLVSIDLDFYKPTFEALCNFYQILVPHGYLMVHDYNHDELGGVKAAVEKFRTMNPSARVVPLPDQCGTVVIVK